MWLSWQTACASKRGLILIVFVCSRRLRVYESQTWGDCHNNKMTIRATFALHNNCIAILKLKTNRQAPNDKRVQFEEDFACCFYSIAYNLTLILYLRRSGSVCFGVRLRPVCCVNAVESLYRITDSARYSPHSLSAQRTHTVRKYTTLTCVKQQTDKHFSRGKLSAWEKNLTKMFNLSLCVVEQNTDGVTYYVVKNFTHRICVQYISHQASCNQRIFVLADWESCGHHNMR